MFFTQNPIGSSATEDLQDNAISLDYAMNSPAALWQDRFGKQHKTVQQALKDVGFKPAGFDFVSGGTLGIGDRDKCVFYPTDGYWYSWNGKLPYVVPANSSPAPGGKKGWGVVTRDERVVAREALRRTYQEVGLNLVDGSFETGAVITSTVDVVLHEKTGKCYSGPVSNVPKGTDPLNGNFVDQSRSSKVIVCRAGDTLNDIILGAPDNGATIKIIGKIHVALPISTEKNINIDCSDGEIFWDGSGGTCLRFNRQPRSVTMGLSVPAIKGARSIPYVPPAAMIGDIVIMKSSDVRWLNAEKDYTWGHPARVTKINESSIEFEPAVTGTYTVNSIEVMEPFRMHSNVKITAMQDTDTSLFNVGWCVDSSFDTILNGTGAQNVGFGVSGINLDIKASVRGFKHGYTSLGYGISVSGHDIKVFGSGSDCRHVTDGGTRDFVSTNLHFDMDVTKGSDAPLFLYTYGIHANCIGVKFRGRVSGAGNLLCDRTGGADIDVEFNEQSTSYSSGCVLINEMPPNGTKIRGKSGGGKCAYVLCNPDGNIGTIDIDISVETHGQKILFSQSLNKSYSKVRIHDCTGEAFQYHGNNWTGCDIEISYRNNILNTIAPYINGYFADFTAAKSVKVESSGNRIDDTQITGLFRFTGDLGSIDFKSIGDENKHTYRFIEATDITATTVKCFDVKNPVTDATINLSLPVNATYLSMGRVIGGNLRHPTNPLSFSAWPCYVADNSFSHTASITLATTIKPGPGNYSKNGQNIVWNNVNQQWPQY